MKVLMDCSRLGSVANRSMPCCFVHITSMAKVQNSEPHPYRAAVQELKLAYHITVDNMMVAGLWNVSLKYDVRVNSMVVEIPKQKSGLSRHASCIQGHLMQASRNIAQKAAQGLASVSLPKAMKEAELGFL